MGFQPSFCHKRPNLEISAKARQYAAKNPYALFKEVLSVEEIFALPVRAAVPMRPPS